jgi:formylmethanofuran dehydrogenase subunit E
MKLVSCSKCFKPVPSNKTVVIDYQRVCHDCKKTKAKKDKWASVR